MSGPWEAYGGPSTDTAPAEGPWKKYASTAPTAAATQPATDPNRVENAVRGFFGAPKVGANPEYEKVLSADSPFADVMPTSPTVLRDLGGLAQGAVKGALGIGPKAVQSAREALQTFSKAGTSPTLGQATGAHLATGAESVLGHFAGGAGVMERTRTGQLSALGDKTAEVANRLAKAASPSVAGNVIRQGLTGPDGFIARFRAQQNVLYSAVDQYIPKNAPVDVTGTMAALRQLNADIPGAKSLSKFFQNAKLQSIERAFKADTAGTKPGLMVAQPDTLSGLGGTPQLAKTLKIPGGSPTNKLPYEAVKKLRTLVGQEMETNSLVAQVPKSKWSVVYAALSKDLQGAADATGNPAAVQAMQRANTFSRAGHERIGNVLDGVTKRAIPEELYQAATNVGDMKAGAARIAGVMKSLQPGERAVVRSAFIQRMGFGPDSAEFNSAQFLRNWNAMSPQAKAVMFSGEGGEIRSSLDAVAKVAAKIKTPSGGLSASHYTGIGLAGGVAVALGSGNLKTAGVLVGAAGGANLSARLMSNPAFVKWLARSIKAPSPELARQAVLGLGKVMQKSDSETQADAQHYAQAVQAALSGVPQ